MGEQVDSQVRRTGGGAGRCAATCTASSIKAWLGAVAVVSTEQMQHSAVPRKGKASESGGTIGRAKGGEQEEVSERGCTRGGVREGVFERGRVRGGRTMGRAPSSLQRSRPANSSSSFTISAPWAQCCRR